MSLFVEQTVSLNSRCAHCGTQFIPSSWQSFCCAGCEFVYGLIHGHGLDRFYKIRDSDPLSCPVPVTSFKTPYEFCEESLFLNKASSDGLWLRFYIEGLNCTACLWLLEQLPQFCGDAVQSKIDMSTSTITVKRQPNGSFAKIAATLAQLGYSIHLLSENESTEQLQTRERRMDLVRIGIAAAATGNIMILAVSNYAGAKGVLATQFHWLTAALALPVLTFCAWPFYKNVFVALRTRHLNIDVPIVVAILAGIVASFWGLVQSQPTVYFDSLAMLILLLLSSRFLLKGIQNSQLRASNLENELLLTSVEKIEKNGHISTVSSAALVEGDRIRVGIGRMIPVDGNVVSGNGVINTSVLTGESEPISIFSGHFVEAGSENLMGNWDLVVKNSPNKTRLAQILRDTERASQQKSEFVRGADHVAKWFVTIVFLLATGLLTYFWSINLQEGISRTLALIIVTCPCVFGMAIPLSMSLAIRKSALNGIVVKSADVFEKIWNTRAVFFDKTGTLTTGQMSVLKVNCDNPAYLEIAFGLEKNQSHPVAQTISKYLSKLGVEAKTPEKIAMIKSGGVCGEISGRRYSLKPRTVSVSSTVESLIRSSYGLFEEDELVATFELGDEVREDAPSVLSWVRRQKFLSELVSGDRRHVAEKCAKAVGFKQEETHFEMSPEQKSELIKKFGEGVVMIGDGANDAMALATADVGIAVCGSLDVSLRAADVYLTKKNLLAIPQLFRIAHMTKKAIYRNLIFSGAFNLLSGYLAMSGMMKPLWAAVLMPISSVTILLSALWTGAQLAKGEK